MKNFFSIFCILIFAYVALNYFTTKAIAIEKFYLINLDASKKLYNNMFGQLKDIKSQIKLERFSATDGRKLQFINKDTNKSITGKEILDSSFILNGDFYVTCSEDKHYTDTNNLLIHYTWDRFEGGTPGHAGALCSHYNIWHEIIDKQYKNTFIMEDDMIFNPNIDKVLNLALHNVPEDYDLLFLSYGPAPESMAFSPSEENRALKIVTSAWSIYKNPFWKKVYRGVNSSRGYIISQAGSTKLSKCIREFESQNYMNADMIIGKCVADKEIIAYASKPVLAPCDEEFPSEIDQS